MAEYKKEYFEKQFEGVPPKVAAIAALRAAMRALPFLGIGGWKPEEQPRRTFKVFRSYQASVFANSLARAGSYVVKAASSAGEEARHVADVGDSGNAGYHVAFAAYFASNTVDRGQAFYAAFAAANAAVAADTDAGSAVQAVASDIDQFRAINPTIEGFADLISTPLWPFEMPPDVNAYWKQLRNDLQHLDAGLRFGSIGIRTASRESPTIGTSNDNGRCFPRSNSLKARLRSMLISKRYATAN